MSNTALLRKETMRRPRLAILVNMIAPYRVPIYTALAESFDTVVLHGGREANRHWELQLPATLKCRSVPTLQLEVRKQTGVAGLWDKTFLHLNIGLLWWLPLTRPDAIFTNELGVRTIAALIYGKLAGVPVWVGSEGSVHSERHIDTGRRWLRRFLFRQIEHWVSFGRNSREYLLSMHVTPQSIVDIQNCVEQELFQRKPRGEAMLPDAIGPVLLSVGQLVPRKGFDKLLDACARVAASGTKFTLVLVGNGPERERLLQQATRLKLANFVLLPNQNTETLNRLYHRADVFVMPSLEDVWGLVASEALWAGCPVLCSKYAGAAEAVPVSNQFDPLSETDFDAALGRALRGDIAAADTSRLMTWQEVSAKLASAVLQQLGQAYEPASVVSPLPKPAQPEVVS